MIPVVVVGSGAAGMMAAIAAAEHPVGTVLLTDRGLGAANSGLAQGGLHVPVDDEEGRRRMVEDVLRAAGPSADPALVRLLVDEAVPTVRLLERWGLRLTVDDGGRWARRRAGGMSEPRIVGADDRIGRSVSRVLRERVRDVGVEVETGAQVVGIERLERGVGLTLADGRSRSARAVVVATGGSTWRRADETGAPSTNPPNENGAIARALLDLGLATVDDDRWQHQPFGLVDVPTGATTATVPETIVEHGVRLLDRDGIEVVDVLAGRLAITAAMHEAIAAGRGVETEHGSGCLLTLSDVDDAVLRDAFPATARLLERAGLLGEDVVVRPALHYQLGGFRIAPDTSTTVAGLYLAGEITGGTHGRNRLMGAGLLESLVQGRRAGRAAASYAEGSSSAGPSGQ